MTIYRSYGDPGHGWVRVHRAELVRLGIADRITRFSYQRGDFVYLEEDGDCAAFVAAKNNRDEAITYHHTHTNRQSKIRSYDRYTATNGGS